MMIVKIGIARFANRCFVLCTPSATASPYRGVAVTVTQAHGALPTPGDMEDGHRSRRLACMLAWPPSNAGIKCSTGSTSLVYYFAR